MVFTVITSWSDLTRFCEDFHHFVFSQRDMVLTHVKVFFSFTINKCHLVRLVTPTRVVAILIDRGRLGARPCPMVAVCWIRIASGWDRVAVY